MIEPTVHLADAIRAAVDPAEVVGARLSEDELRLRRPLQTARASIDRRRVIRVALDVIVDGHRRRGWGEAAPLRPWGSEKLEHALYDMRRLRDAVEAGRVVDGADAVEMMRPPTARFAVQSAILDAVARARGVPLRRLFATRPPNAVPLSAAIGPVDAAAAASLATQAVADGYPTLQVKVGGDLDDVARVAAVRDVARGAALRLDANGAWTEGEAVEHLRLLAADDVQYVQQPVAGDCVDALQRLTASSPVPIAADASCLPLERAHQLLARRAVHVLVLRPSLLGAWSDVMQTVEEALRSDVAVVFASAFDSAVNRAAVAQFATLLPTGTTCDLMAGGGFENDAGWEEVARGGRLYLGSGDGIGFRPCVSFDARGGT
jgi:o-succinylbenzoate synthase